jgi:endonuclease YncB( thermonuclease family)
MYRYKAFVKRVIDGDTLILSVDLGFKISVEIVGRLLGVDTPELRGGTYEEKIAGREARDKLKTAVEGKTVWISTEKTEKYGRWLIEIWDNFEFRGPSLNQRWLTQGIYAIPAQAASEIVE